MTVAIPYMIDPDSANLRGKIGFLFGMRTFPQNRVETKGTMESGNMGRLM